MRMSSFKSEAMALSHKKIKVTTQGQRQVAAPSGQFRCIGVLFTRDEIGEREIDRWMRSRLQ